MNFAMAATEGQEYNSTTSVQTSSKELTFLLQKHTNGIMNYIVQELNLAWTL